MNVEIYQCCRLSGCGFAVGGRKVVSVSEGGCGYRCQRALDAVRQGDYYDVPSDLWYDRAFVLEAVTHSGLVFQFASEKLQGDELVVKAAVTRDGQALRYAKCQYKTPQRQRHCYGSS